MSASGRSQTHPMHFPLQRRVVLLSVAALALSGSVLASPSAAHAAPPVTEVDFVYSADAAQTFTVPTGVTSIQYSVTGAAGGKGGGANGGTGGSAHVVTGSLDVTAGQVLNIYVAAPGGDGLRTDDAEDDTPTAGLPGEGGWGYTTGGDGGFGSVRARPGGGGGGSSAIVVQGQSTPAVVGAGGGGGGGRGIVGFCFGGDGGAGDLNGAAGFAGDDCLIPGLGGLTDYGLSGNGTDGGDVILFGGGGGGGGAGAATQGGGGGFAGAHPGVPVNLGAGGGGGAGGGSVASDPSGEIDVAGPTDAATVQLTFSRSFDTAVAATTVGTTTYGDPVSVSIAVSNTTDPAITVTDGTVTLSQGGSVLATENVVNGEAAFTLDDLPPGTIAFDIAYAPAATSVFEASTGAGSFVVTPAPTSIQLVIGTAPRVGSTQISATVTADNATLGVPTGSVQFFAGGSSLGIVPLENGVAILTTAKDLPGGDYELTATYLGTTAFASSSVEVPLTIAAAPAVAAIPHTGVDAAASVLAGAVLLLGGLLLLGMRRRATPAR